jgi:hypothetical protein
MARTAAEWLQEERRQQQIKGIPAPGTKGTAPAALRANDLSHMIYRSRQTEYPACTPTTTDLGLF